MARDVIVHLVLISGVGPGAIATLLRRLTYEQLSIIYQFTVADFVTSGLTPLVAQKIVAGLADKKLIEDELALIERHHITVLTHYDEQYPELLRHIHLPPACLYVQGVLPQNYSKSLAIVGSRDANEYGYAVVEHILRDLVPEWTIISGGARGIDTHAHRTTLKAQGATLAIIGSGLLEPYPLSNKNLFHEIAVRGGAVVSPFPLTSKALPGNFPARNRIIAGMARGCLVAQAAAQSGALITAYSALKEGREVCAVPGSIFDPLSAGCLALILEGATPVTNGADINKLFGFAGDQEEESVVHRHAVIPGVKDTILAFCEEPRSFDLILAHEQCSQKELYDRLWEFQVAGLIEETAAGKWRAIL